jgi:hypothetical protein
MYYSIKIFLLLLSTGISIVDNEGHTKYIGKLKNVQAQVNRTNFIHERLFERLKTLNLKLMGKGKNENVSVYPSTVAHF